MTLAYAAITLFTASAHDTGSRCYYPALPCLHLPILQRVYIPSATYLMLVWLRGAMQDTVVRNGLGQAADMHISSIQVYVSSSIYTVSYPFYCIRA